MRAALRRHREPTRFFEARALRLEDGMKRLAILSVALVACAPKVGPDLRKEFPAAAEALVAIEPGCRRPSPTNYEACRRSAMMLDSDAPRATAIFLATWDAQTHREK